MGHARAGSAAQGGQPQSWIFYPFSPFSPADWPDLQVSSPNSNTGSRVAARMKKYSALLMPTPFIMKENLSQRPLLNFLHSVGQSQFM